MSRSKKDGRRKGGHTNTQGKEVWSRRPTRYRMAELSRVVKRDTHRRERRIAKRDLRTTDGDVV